MNLRKGKQHALEMEHCVPRARDVHENKNSYYLLNIQTNEAVLRKTRFDCGKRKEKKNEIILAKRELY